VSTASPDTYVDDAAVVLGPHGALPSTGVTSSNSGVWAGHHHHSG